MPVLHKEQKEWNHEDSQQCDQYTGYFQVDSGDWRKVVIICLFDHIKDGGWQDQCRWEVSVRMITFPSIRQAQAVSGRSVNLYFGWMYHLR